MCSAPRPIAYGCVVVVVGVVVVVVVDVVLLVVELPMPIALRKRRKRDGCTIVPVVVPFCTFVTTTPPFAPVVTTTGAVTLEVVDVVLAFRVRAATAAASAARLRAAAVVVGDVVATVDLAVTGTVVDGVAAEVEIAEGAETAVFAGLGTESDEVVGVSAPVPAAVCPTVKPGVVFVGFASAGFAVTARAVVFDMPFATAPVTPTVGVAPVLLFTAAAVAGETALVPETPVVTLGAAVTAAVPPSAALLAAGVKIAPASPSAPLVMTGVGVELFDEFTVCCGFA